MMKHGLLERNYNQNNPKIRLLLNDIIDKLRQGYSRAECVRYLNKEYKYSRPTAYKYIHDAYVDLYEASLTTDLTLLKEQYIDRIEYMLQRALESRKYDQAARFQEMLNKLSGMYVEKQDVNINSNNIKFKFDS